MEKRTTKFYRKNEEEVMQTLGLTPTKNSGAGWIEKEDGQNDYVICQLKSTDAQSIKVNQKDLRILEHNASVTHKIPLFAIQFLNTGEVWLLAKPEDFTSVSEYIKTGKTASATFSVEIDTSKCTDMSVKCDRVIGSAAGARERFHKENNRKYNKSKSAK